MYLALKPPLRSRRRYLPPKDSTVSRRRIKRRELISVPPTSISQMFLPTLDSTSAPTPRASECYSLRRFNLTGRRRGEKKDLVRCKLSQVRQEVGNHTGGSQLGAFLPPPSSLKLKPGSAFP